MGILKFSDLTDKQKNILCNGCGPKAWGGLQPPQFIFVASCDQHDFYYWRGGIEEDRKKADREFYAAMLTDVKNASWYKKPHYHIWAGAYYLAVRVGGGLAFTYLDKTRTMGDLLLFEKRYNSINGIMEESFQKAMDIMNDNSEEII